MASWGAFTRADPSFGALALARIDGEGLVMVGTLRRNGWPRISPVEPLVLDDELYLGMMHQSRKALDMMRDPRCVVHSIVHDKGGADGDVKVYGRAAAVEGLEERERYCRALEARIGWRPEGEFHLFTVASPRWATSRWPTGTTTPGPGRRPWAHSEPGLAGAPGGRPPTCLSGPPGPCHNVWAMRIGPAHQLIALVLVS